MLSVCAEDAKMLDCLDISRKNGLRALMLATSVNFHVQPIKEASPSHETMTIW